MLKFQENANITWGTLRAISLTIALVIVIFSFAHGHCYVLDIELPSSFSIEQERAEKERRGKEAYEKIQEWNNNESDRNDGDSSGPNEPSGRDYAESVDYEANHCV